MAHAHEASRAVKVVAVALIVFAVVGIWLFKNSQRALSHNYMPENPDFVVYAQSIDMEKWKSYGLPILILFGDECEECAILEANLEDLAEANEGNVMIKVLNAEQNPKLTVGYPISILPTMFFYGADGNAYVPDSSETGISLITFPLGGTPEYTMYQGEMTKNQLVFMLRKLGVQA